MSKPSEHSAETIGLMRPLPPLSMFTENFLIALERAVFNGDVKTVRRLKSDLPNLKLDLFGNTDLFRIYRPPKDGIDMNENIPFEVFVGYCGHKGILDEILTWENNEDERRSVALNALYGAVQNPFGGDMVKHIMRRHRCCEMFFSGDDLKTLIDRDDHDLLAFVLGKGVLPDTPNVPQKNFAIFHALATGKDKSVKLLQAAGSLGSYQKMLSGLCFDDDTPTGIFLTRQDRFVTMKSLLSDKPGRLPQNFESLEQARNTTITLMFNELKLDINGIMAAAINRRFEGIIELSLRTGEKLTRADLYDRGACGVSPIDIMRHTHVMYFLFNEKLWQKNPDALRDFYMALEPLERYKWENRYAETRTKLLPLQHRLQGQARCALPKRKL